MIKSVIFDLGKVIIFFDNQIFFKKMENFCPLSAEEISALVSQNLSLLQAFDKGEIDPDAFYEAVVERLKAKVDKKAFFAIYNNVFAINPPVFEALLELKKECRLILLSNTDVERFGFVKKRFPEILVFDEYVLSYEVGSIKPDPRIYKIAVERAGASPHECIFFDDREENIAAAKEEGIHAVLFSPQTDLKTVLRSYGLLMD